MHQIEGRMGPLRILGRADEAKMYHTKGIMNHLAFPDDLCTSMLMRKVIEGKDHDGLRHLCQNLESACDWILENGSAEMLLPLACFASYADHAGALETLQERAAEEIEDFSMEAAQERLRGILRACRLWKIWDLHGHPKGGLPKIWQALQGPMDMFTDEELNILITDLLRMAPWRWI